MKVFLFGAGASRSAGYPLASELLRAIEADAQDSRLVNLRDAWQRWRMFRDTVEPPLRLFVHNPNPEIILSHLDLCEAAMGAHDDDHFGRAARAMRGEAAADDDKQDDYWRSRARGALEQARIARDQLLECLREYFDFKHYEDGRLEQRGSRDYLRRALGQLDAGDAVVTLNWDTTVERTLAEDNRWHPTTGYGFAKELSGGISAPEAGEARQVIPQCRSEISVLKLHGSTGWYTGRHGRIYFYPSYLFGFAFEQPLVDPEPRVGSPEGAILLYPSYLKKVKGLEVQTIWHRAEQAFAEARKVEVWGYSLPESDTGIRVLLNPLRFRLDAGIVDVTIHDPDPEVQARWRDFLGPGAGIDGQRL